MTFLETELEGVYVVRPFLHQDARGTFVKGYQTDAFREAGIPFEVREEFYSTSARGVVRGMHFQLPPKAYSKLVYCVRGSVLDVVLDLRSESRTCGRFYSRQLSAENREQLLIPSGVAHGFLSLDDDSTMVYKTDVPHSPEHDSGVRWDSFGFEWPVQTPKLSPRDASLTALADFRSPF